MPITQNISNRSKDSLHECLSEDDVKIVVAKALGPDAKLVNYQFKPYSEDRVGFLGAHSLLEVTVEKDDSSVTRTFFVKSLPHGSAKEMEVIKKLQVFEVETNFYRQIEPELLKDFKGDPWGPECYLVKDDVLVFENLGEKNFKMADLVFDKPTIESTISTLARFHAASVLAEKRMGHTFPEKFPKLITQPSCDSESLFHKWFEAGAELVASLAVRLKLDTTGVKKYLMDILEPGKTTTEGRNVICHGDLYPDNTMINDESDPPTCRIVDYQTIRYTPQSMDLADLIFKTTSQKTRDDLEDDLVKQYHKMFKETVLRNDPDCEVGSLEELLEEYKKSRRYGLSMAAFHYPQNHMDKHLKSKATSTSEGYEKFFFHYQTRSELVKDHMNNDPIYQKKITAITREVVEEVNKTKHPA